MKLKLYEINETELQNNTDVKNIERQKYKTFLGHKPTEGSSQLKSKRNDPDFCANEEDVIESVTL